MKAFEPLGTQGNKSGVGYILFSIVLKVHLYFDQNIMKFGEFVNLQSTTPLNDLSLWDRETRIMVQRSKIEIEAHVNYVINQKCREEGPIPSGTTERTLVSAIKNIIYHNSQQHSSAGNNRISYQTYSSVPNAPICVNNMDNAEQADTLTRNIVESSKHTHPNQNEATNILSYKRQDTRATNNENDSPKILLSQNEFENIYRCYMNTIQQNTLRRHVVHPIEVQNLHPNVYMNGNDHSQEFFVTNGVRAFIDNFKEHNLLVNKPPNEVFGAAQGNVGLNMQENFAPAPSEQDPFTNYPCGDIDTVMQANAVNTSEYFNHSSWGQNTLITNNFGEPEPELQVNSWASNIPDIHAETSCSLEQNPITNILNRHPNNTLEHDFTRSIPSCYQYTWQQDDLSNQLCNIVDRDTLLRNRRQSKPRKITKQRQSNKAPNYNMESIVQHDELTRNTTDSANNPLEETILTGSNIFDKMVQQGRFKRDFEETRRGTFSKLHSKNNLNSYNNTTSKHSNRIVSPMSLQSNIVTTNTQETLNSKHQEDNKDMFTQKVINVTKIPMNESFMTTNLKGNAAEINGISPSTAVGNNTVKKNSLDNSRIIATNVLTSEGTDFSVSATPMEEENAYSLPLFTIPILNIDDETSGAQETEETEKENETLPLMNAKPKRSKKQKKVFRPLQFNDNAELAFGHFNPCIKEPVDESNENRDDNFRENRKYNQNYNYNKKQKNRKKKK